MQKWDYALFSRIGWPQKIDSNHRRETMQPYPADKPADCRLAEKVENLKTPDLFASSHHDGQQQVNPRKKLQIQNQNSP